MAQRGLRASIGPEFDPQCSHRKLLLLFTLHPLEPPITPLNPSCWSLPQDLCSHSTLLSGSPFPDFHMTGTSVFPHLTFSSLLSYFPPNLWPISSLV